jgi:hypothetical protein
VDPAQPGRLGAFTVEVEVGGERVEATGPARLRVAEDPGRVDVLAPDGTRLAQLECENGRCRLATPVGAKQVPAATVQVDGSGGVLGGFELTGPDGQTRVQASVVGDQGVRVWGQALGEQLSLAPGLFVEGSARDVDAVRWDSPTGHSIGLALAGDEARGQAASRSTSADPADLWLEGDPLTDDEVDVVAESEGERGIVHVRQTPSRAFEESDRSGELEHVASPTAPPNATLSLDAGPVERASSGAVSSAFEATARLVVDDDRTDRAWLTLDGERGASFREAGQTDDGRVFLARLPAGVIGDHGDTVDVSAIVERDAAPGLVQRLEAANLTVAIDARGPTAPSVAWQRGEVRVNGSADRLAAQARAPEGVWRERAVTNGTVALPDTAEPGWQVRVRGVDAVGNPGPWSQPVEVPERLPEREASEPFRVVAAAVESTLEGTVPILWTPEAAAGQISVHARHEGADAWTEIGSSTTSPIEWRTEYERDGTYRLQVRAMDGPHAVSRLLTVTVDNLDPTGPPQEQSRQQAELPDQRPDPGQPLARSLALLGTAGALAGIGVGVAKRRDK